MNINATEKSAEKSKVWDIFILQQDGAWTGFRARWMALRRTSFWFASCFLLAALASVGWIWTRFENGRMEAQVAQLQLEADSLKRSASTPETSVPHAERSLVLPTLDNSETLSGVVRIASWSALYDAKASELQFDLNLERNSQSLPSSGAERFTWVGLLHSAHGIMSFPASFMNSSGDLIQPTRGEVIESIGKSRQVKARYKTGNFIEMAGAEPVYVTVLVYDAKGSLIVRARQELKTK